MVAQTVEGGLEAVKGRDKEPAFGLLSHAEKRRREAPAKGSLALKGAGAHVFMRFRRQVTLGQIQEGSEG